MTGEEVHRALDTLDHDYHKTRRKMMEEYDKSVYYPARKALIEQCPHEALAHWWRNGIGWSWLECKFCGHRLDQGETETHGGRLYGER